MLIDPFTVFAQIVNFALLVWLLSRFLYGPVTRAMNAREARVREKVEEARRLHAEAQAEGDRYRALLAGVEAEREALLGEVQAELDTLRHEQAAEIRREARELRERWNRTLEREKEAFLRRLRQQVGQESLVVMRRALRELADENLENRLIERFIDRLRAMEARERERLSAAVRRGEETFQVRTAFPLSDAHREVLARSLAEIFKVESSPRFETDPALVAGVELRAGGLKAAWTLDDYLLGLEEAMRAAFHETTMQTAGAGDHG